MTQGPPEGTTPGDGDGAAVEARIRAEVSTKPTEADLLKQIEDLKKVNDAQAKDLFTLRQEREAGIAKAVESHDHDRALFGGGLTLLSLAALTVGGYAMISHHDVKNQWAAIQRAAQAIGLGGVIFGLIRAAERLMLTRAQVAEVELRRVHRNTGLMEILSAWVASRLPSRDE